MENFQLTGATVTIIKIDYSLTLVTDSDAEISISTNAEIMDDSVTMTIDPEVPDEALLPVFGFLHQKIDQCEADDSGQLIVRTGRTVLVVPPSELYEAWIVSRVDGFRAVCPPGGGEITIWPALPPDHRQPG